MTTNTINGMIQRINPQQTSMIIPDMDTAARVFFSQQAHIWIIINPPNTEKVTLPQFDLNEIKIWLNEANHQDLYFNSKFPKHIIVLNSKQQYYDCLRLVKAINSQKISPVYGNTFFLSVQFAESMIEVDGIVQKIKKQQHTMQLNKIIERNSQFLSRMEYSIEQLTPSVSVKIDDTEFQNEFSLKQAEEVSSKEIDDEYNAHQYVSDNQQQVGNIDPS